MVLSCLTRSISGRLPRGLTRETVRNLDEIVAFVTVRGIRERHVGFRRQTGEQGARVDTPNWQATWRIPGFGGRALDTFEKVGVADGNHPLVCWLAEQLGSSRGGKPRGPRRVGHAAQANTAGADEAPRSDVSRTKRGPR